MNQNDNKLFWGICLFTALIGIYWSLTSVLKQPSPLFIAFLAVNIVSALTIVVCLIIDIRKGKKK